MFCKSITRLLKCKKRVVSLLSESFAGVVQIDVGKPMLLRGKYKPNRLGGSISRCRERELESISQNVYGFCGFD